MSFTKRTRKVTFLWKLQHFGDCLFEKEEIIESPCFKVDRQSWKVVMVMQEGDKASIYWQIDVQNDNTNEYSRDCLLAILNSRNERIRSNNANLRVNCDENTTDILDKDGTLVILVELYVELEGLYRPSEINKSFTCSYVFGCLPQFVPEFPSGAQHKQKLKLQQEEIEFTTEAYKEGDKRYTAVEVKTAIKKFHMHCVILESSDQFLFTDACLNKVLEIPSEDKPFTIFPRYIIKEGPVTELHQEIVPINDAAEMLQMIQTSPDLQTYKKFFQNQTFADVIINVKGKTLYAHKIILAAHSSIFEKMLECHTGAIQTINIDEHDYETIATLLEYMYNGKVNGLAPGIADKLLPASDAYGIGDLKTFCENILIKQITTEKATKLFMLAENAGAMNLRKVAANFVINNPDSLKYQVK